MRPRSEVEKLRRVKQNLIALLYTEIMDLKQSNHRYNAMVQKYVDMSLVESRVRANLECESDTINPHSSSNVGLTARPQ
jgi:hypothetical protein